MTPTNPRTSTSGFTLMEIIVVVAVIGLVGFFSVIAFNGARVATLSGTAIKQAELIDNARDQYALTVPNSAAAWAAATSDEEKLNLLIDQGLLLGPASRYLSMEGGYSVTLSGGIRGTTSVTSSSP